MAVKILVGIAVALALFVIVFVLIARKSGSTVHVERTFHAPVEKIWRLWNDQESMKAWWGPKDYTAPVIRNDFRVNGAYLFSMRSPKGELHWNTGSYKEIVVHQRIVSTMSFSDENGKAIPGTEVRLPGEWPDALTVTVEFREVDGNTTVDITEEGIPLIMKLFAGMGWQQQLDKL